MRVFLVDGKRSPYVKAFTFLRDIPALYLGEYLIKYFLKSYPLDLLDEFIVGTVYQPAECANFARNLGLVGGLNEKIPAYTVQRNCASGLQAFIEGFLSIYSGKSHFILAGGIESMSRMPFVPHDQLQNFLWNILRARSLKEKIFLLKDFPWTSFFKLNYTLEQGLTDGFVGLKMGDTAEILARTYQISRLEQDEFALRSHQLAIQFKKEEEILPFIGDKIYKEDIGPRDNLTLEQLQKLKPYFDPLAGTVTVGNSSPLTDGAAMNLLASEKLVQEQNWQPLAEIIDYHHVALSPKIMGLGPVNAILGLLNKTGLKFQDIDLFEINEAFAAQVLSVIKELRKQGYDLPLEKLNTQGGAIAMGHPVGSSGARLSLSLAYQLRKQGKKYGIATLCVGGGQGSAVLLRNVT